MVTFVILNGTGWPPSGAANTCVQNALDEIGSWINATSILDVRLNWENLGGSVASAGPSSMGASETYATVKGYLATLQTRDALTNNIKSTAYGALPVSDPAGAPITYRIHQFWRSIKDNTDHHNTSVFVINDIHLNSTFTFDTDPTGLGPTTGFGMYQAILHECTHLLGRQVALTPDMSPVDLFTFSSAGVRNVTLSGTRNSSWDDGVTSLGTNNGGGGNDYIGWSFESGDGYKGFSNASPFNATTGGNDPQLPRYKDIQLLSVMGLPLTALGLKAAGFPTNTVAPVISGTQQVGQTLSVAAGTWVGESTITKTYQWKRNGVAIGGATAATYSVVSADAGTGITVAETGTNTLGGQAQASNELDIPATPIGGKTQSGSSKFTSRPIDMPLP